MDRFIVLAGLVAFLFGCDSSGVRNPGTSGWGSAVTLTGDPVGKGTDPVDQLTREIPLNLSGLGITGTSAVLGRQFATSVFYRFIAPVTNHGGRRQCFINTVTFDLLDTAGAVIGTPVSEFVTGSVGKLKDGSMHTNSCLEVGETGYLLSLLGANPAYPDVASARISFTSSESEWVAPATTVIPMAYSAPVRDKAYTVTIANQGPAIATVSMSKVLYFNETNTPAYWGFLEIGTETNHSPYDLAPGATTTLTCEGGTELWTGSSTKLMVFVDFRVKGSGELPTLAVNAKVEAAVADRAGASQ